MNIQTFALLVQADIPAMLWSDPGVGKTKFVESLARALGLPLHTEILSQADPTDLGGWPREEGNVIRRKPLAWLQGLCDRPGILFLDETTLAPRSCLAASLRLINERAAGEVTLHADTRIILASNPAEFTGVDLLPQTANRMAHIDFEDMFPLAAWNEGMVGGFPTPAIGKLIGAWRTLIPKHRAIIAACAARMAHEMFRHPKETSAMGRAWPSRRTWDMAAHASAACEAGHEDDALAVAALVGEGPALAYVSWRAQQDLGNPDEALTDPHKYPLPTEDEKLYILLSGVAAAAVAKEDAKKWGNAWTLLGRVCTMKKADVAAMAARVLALQKPKGAVVPKEAAALLPLFQVAGICT